MASIGYMRDVGSRPTNPHLRLWRNSSRAGLRIPCRKTCRCKSYQPYHLLLRGSVAQLVEHSTFNAVVMRSSRIGVTSGGILFMTIEIQRQGLQARYNRLAANGRNTKSTGVLRKLARQIRKLNKVD